MTFAEELARAEEYVRLCKQQLTQSQHMVAAWQVRYSHAVDALQRIRACERSEHTHGKNETEGMCQVRCLHIPFKPWTSQ